MYPSLLEILTQNFNDEPSSEDSSKSSKSIIGSPRDVYNYDVINRISDEDYEIENKNNDKEIETEKNSNSNNSDIIEGNMNLFDLMDKKTEL